MSKPCGISMNMLGGMPSMLVTMPTTTENAIWDAVEAAADSNTTPDDFMREVREAWETTKQKRLKWELDDLRKGIK